MLAMEDSTSRDCAREMRGTASIASTVIGREAREVLTGTGLPVLATELGYRTDYQEASAAGMGASTYRPSSVSAVEVRGLVDELEVFAGLRPASRKRRAGGAA